MTGRSHSRFAALLARESLISCNRGPGALLLRSLLPRETFEQLKGGLRHRQAINQGLISATASSASGKRVAPV